MAGLQGVEDAPVPGTGRGLRQRDRQRPARDAASSRSRVVDLVVEVGEVGDDLQHARPVWPMARAMPTSSSRAAVSVGVGSPRLVRWLRVREVVKPRAPASTPSAASRPISAISSAVAGSRSAPRWPMTYRRTGPWQHLGGEVDVVRAALEGVEVARRCSPTPRRALRAAPCRGCPRPLPSARSAGRGRPAAPARSRRRSCPSRPW